MNIKIPITTAIRFLNDNKVFFEPYEYDYQEKGGTSQTALELNIDEYSVIKTLIFQADKEIICVLMHGNYEVSTKELSRNLNVKFIEQVDEKTAFNATGYKFGGTSPFGTRKALKIYVEESILNLDKIYINGGKQGFIIAISPESLGLLDYKTVNVAIKK